MDLENETRARIKELVAAHKAPAILCSFGKDSLTVLHLTRKMGLRLPVIFHRDPWEPRKTAFANRLIEAWDLVVEDWPPSACGIKVNGTLEIVSRYQVGPDHYLDIPMSILEPAAGEHFACGLRDVIERPKGSFLHPWDLYLHGHKSSDIDPYEGPVPLKQNYIPSPCQGAPAIAFPLEKWTDADIWSYLNANHVPVEERRYDRSKGIEYDDKRNNSDYLTACTLCIDPRQPAMVPCPKRNGEPVRNVSVELFRFDKMPNYIGKP